MNTSVTFFLGSQTCSGVAVWQDLLFLPSLMILPVWGIIKLSLKTVVRIKHIQVDQNKIDAKNVGNVFSFKIVL